MENFLESLNIYPHPITLNHKNKNLFFSIYGTIFSFLSYGITFYLTYYFSYDLLFRNNPKIKSSQSYMEKSDTIDADRIINKMTLNVEVNFDNFVGNIEPEKILNMTTLFGFIIGSEKDMEIFYAKNIISKIKKIYNSQHNFSYNFDVEMTSQLEFYKTIVDQTMKYKLKDFHINGDSDCFLFLSFRKDVLLNLNISKIEGKINLNDNAIEIEKHDNYSKSFNIDFPIKKSKLKQIINYRMIQVNTDSNPFISGKISKLIPQIDYCQYEDLELNHYDQFEIKYEPLIGLKFRKIKYIYMRVYKKILDVLSEVGGVLNPVLILGKFLVLKLNEKKYKLSVLNDVFTDEEINRKDLTIHKKIIENEDFGKKKSKGIEKSKNSNKKIINLNKTVNEEKEIKEGKIENSDKNICVDINTLSKDLNKKEKFKIESSRSLINEVDLSIDSSQTENLFKKYKKELKIPQEKNIFRSVDGKLNRNNNGIFISSMNQSNLRKEKLDDILNLNSFIEKDIIILKDQKTKVKIKTYLKIKSQNNNQLLRYSFSEILLSFFCHRKNLNKNFQEKENIFDKILDRVNFYFEITNIIRLFRNFEKIRLVIFNQNQINCLDYINDNNYKYKKNEENILFNLTNYFERKNSNDFEKFIDESIKLILKNDVKNLIIGE